MLQGVYFATGFLHYLVAPHASWSREPALREGVLREAARGGERLARLLAGRHARTAQAAAGVLWLLASDDEMGGDVLPQLLPALPPALAVLRAAAGAPSAPGVPLPPTTAHAAGFVWRLCDAISGEEYYALTGTGNETGKGEAADCMLKAKRLMGLKKQVQRAILDARPGDGVATLLDLATLEASRATVGADMWHPAGVDGREHAAGVLLLMLESPEESIRDETKARCWRLGAPRQLVRCMERCAGDGARGNAAGCLWRLADSSEHVAAVGAAGAAAACSAALKMHAKGAVGGGGGGKKGKKKSKKSKKGKAASLTPQADRLLMHCSGALCHLALVDELKPAVIASGCLPPLVGLLKSPNATTRANATGAVWSAGTHEDAAPILVKCGAPKYLAAPVHASWTSRQGDELLDPNGLNNGQGAGNNWDAANESLLKLEPAEGVDFMISRQREARQRAVLHEHARAPLAAGGLAAGTRDAGLGGAPDGTPGGRKLATLTPAQVTGERNLALEAARAAHVAAYPTLATRGKAA